MSKSCFQRATLLAVTLLLCVESWVGYAASTVDLSGKSGWVAVMYGINQDPVGDSQAGAADTDIVGDAFHGSLYTVYDSNGTVSTVDDTLVFRLRIDNPTAATIFSGVGVVGIDANQDGKIDIFVSVDGRKSVQAVRLLDPGTGLNNSPSTTTTAPLPLGWLPNNGIYPLTTENYSVAGVSSLTDPHWNGNVDIGNDGKLDTFVSWRIPMADVAAVLAKPSPVDRSGGYGPRGASGIPGFNKDTLVSYVAFTQTQPGPINGDLDGVGASYEKNATYASLGALTAPMSPDAPVASGPQISITQPISGGLLNASEDHSVSFPGTSSYLGGRILTLSVTDGTLTITGSTVIAVDGSWTVSGLNLSTLSNGTLTVTASADPDGDLSTDNNVAAVATVLHDNAAPVISINILPGTTAGTPLFSGTCDLPDGSLLTITVDPDNDSATANLIYVVPVSGGQWSLDTATAIPVSRAMASAGFTAYAKVTASGSDAAGNTTTTTLIDRPSVNALTSNRTTPTLSGNWTKITGDTLTIAVSGATYSLSPSGNTWSVDLATAVPNSGSLTPLVAGSVYNVTATVTRGATSVSDVTSNELTITSVPVKNIAINGGPTVSTNDTTPLISGTSQNAGAYVIVRIDPGNDGELSDAVSYSVTPDGAGDWVLDTGTATPISGIRFGAGFLGTNGVLATDSTGAASASQVLIVALPSMSITAVNSTATSNAFGVVNNSGTNANWLNVTEDDAVSVSGTGTAGFTVDLTITDNKGLAVVTNSVPVAGNGSWSANNLNLSSLDDGVLEITATLSGTSVTATNRSVTHDKTAPRIFITTQSTIPKNSADISGASELPNTVLQVLILNTNGSTLIYSNVVTTSVSGTWTINTGNGQNLVSGGSGYVILQVQPLSSTTDAAGNIAQKDVRSNQFVQNGAANTTQTISIAAIAGDDVISLGEFSAGLQITGVTSLTSASTNAFSVSVTDGTVTNAATVTANNSGSWTALLSKSQISSLKTGPLTIYASVTDSSSSITIYAVRLATLDLNNPTLAITDNAPITATNTITFTFTFSEVVTGFAIADITVSSGTAGAFSGSGSQYSLLVTPPANSSGTITVSVPNGAANSTNTARPTVGDVLSQAFNTTAAAAAPSLTLNTAALVTNCAPVLTGTTSLQPGASVVLDIDVDNDGNLDLSYSATVQSGGNWSVDVSLATPSFGAFPPAGLPPYSKVTATAINAYGIGATVIGLNTPTVNRQVTNNSRPNVTGSWTQVAGDTVIILLNGVTYSTANLNLNLTSTNWSLSPSTPLADGYYDVAAVVSRPGFSSVGDLTTNELSIDTQAIIEIAGGAQTNIIANAFPLISGASAGFIAGTVVTLSLDVDDDGSVDLAYKTSLAVDGSWSVDTATAIPVTGALPIGGLSGLVPLSVAGSDQAGNVAVDTQILVVDLAPPSIAFTFNGRTSLPFPLLTGISDLSVGSLVTLLIDPNDDGDYSDAYTYTATVQSGGYWAVPVTNVLSGTVNVEAFGQDEAGNTGTITRLLSIESSVPAVGIAQPIDANGNNILDASEDDSVVIHGNSTNIPSGAQIEVQLTDGTLTLSDTAFVGNDGTWSLLPFNLSSMANGLITVSATYLDEFANAYVDMGTVTHDKSGTLSIDGLTLDTGVLGDFITSDTTVAFFGSAPASSAVNVKLTSSLGGLVFNSNVVADITGVWMVDYRAFTLTSGAYNLQASSGTTVTQAIDIDAVPPVGPVTVDSLVTNSSTPTLTGTAKVNPGETLQVTVNAVTYKADDGFLSTSGTNWSLSIGIANALAPASIGGGFDGDYPITATIQDSAGNAFSGSGFVTIQDIVPPVISLDPTSAGSLNGTTLNNTVTWVPSAPVSLDDNADPATLLEASDLLANVKIAVAGLLDGNGEQLIFGSTPVLANGVGGNQTGVVAAGVPINILMGPGVLTLQKFDYSAFNSAEAQAVIREIQYQNTNNQPSLGTRTFTFTTTDEAGNTSAAAVSSVQVALAKSTQTINFPVIADQTSTNTLVLTATASSSLPVTFEIVSGAALLSGNALTFSATGPVSVAARQSGDSNYDAAPSVTNTFNVIASLQAALLFVPSSPQVYNTTNQLAATGGSGSGTISFEVLIGPAEIVGTDKLWITNGTGVIALRAIKAGDTLYSAESVTGLVTAARATAILSLSSSLNPAGYRDRITFTSATSSDNGTIQFHINNTDFGGTFNVSGSPVSIDSVTLPRGTNVVSSFYSGDSNYLPATNSIGQIVTNHPPAVTNATFNRSGLNRWKIKASDLVTNAFDVDGDVLTVQAIGASTNGISLQLFGGYLQYFNTNQVDDKFVCRVDDGFGGTNDIVVTLTAGLPAGGTFGQNNVVTVQNGEVHLHFAAIPGYAYSVQRSIDFASWQVLLTTNTPASGVFEFTDSSPPQPAAYYRLWWLGN